MATDLELNPDETTPTDPEPSDPNDVDDDLRTDESADDGALL